MKTIKMIGVIFSELKRSSRFKKNVIIFVVTCAIALSTRMMDSIPALNPEEYLDRWFLILASIFLLGYISMSYSIGNICDEVSKIKKEKFPEVKKEETPNSEFEEIRKAHRELYLFRFYAYCTFLASAVIFFWWFIKQVTLEVVNPERIVIGYLVEFSIILIVAGIFLSVKLTEEQLHNHWKSVFKEKFAL